MFAVFLVRGASGRDAAGGLGRLVGEQQVLEGGERGRRGQGRERGKGIGLHGASLNLIRFGLRCPI